MNSPVRYESADGVATLTLDDGKVNVLGFAMQDALNAALDRAAAENAAVVLTGNAKVFSGGFDLAVFKAGGPDVARMLDGGGTLARRLLRFPRPVVIASSGHAMAMGALLLLTADHRIGLDSGMRVQMNETAIGMTLPHFAVALCQGRLGAQWVGRVLVNAEALDPVKAVSSGFLDETAPAGELLTRAQERAKALAALHPGAFIETRARVHAAMHAGLEAAKALDTADWAKGVLPNS